VGTCQASMTATGNPAGACPAAPAACANDLVQAQAHASHVSARIGRCACACANPARAPRTRASRERNSAATRRKEYADHTKK
jgi:hypothetical protein